MVLTEILETEVEFTRFQKRLLPLPVGIALNLEPRLSRHDVRVAKVSAVLEVLDMRDRMRAADFVPVAYVQLKGREVQFDPRLLAPLLPLVSSSSPDLLVEFTLVGPAPMECEAVVAAGSSAFVLPRQMALHLLTRHCVTVDIEVGLAVQRPRFFEQLHGLYTPLRACFGDRQRPACLHVP